MWNFFVIERNCTKLSEVVVHTYLGTLSVTLEHVPCGDFEDREIYANEEENCSD
jgi:hypothetical protein